MPLSEHEQKILDEIEKSLSDEDPRFAQERRPQQRSHRHAARARLGAGMFVAGFALLIVFFLSRFLFVGLVAFGAMVTGIVLLASPVSALVNSTKENAGRTRENIKSSASGWDENLRKRFRRR